MKSDASSGLAPEPLATFLRLYCNVEAAEFASNLREHILSGAVEEEQAELLHSQLADAIASASISPEEYKKLTGDNEYQTPEEVAEALREFQQLVFPAA